MKKVYIIAIALLLVGSYSAQAQLIKFGVKGGVNFPSLSSTVNSVSFDNKTGWHAGAAVELNIPIVKVGAEFLYSSSKTTVDIATIKNDLETATFDIPVYAKLKLLKILQIHTGPQFSFVTSAKLDGTDIKDQWSESTFRWMAGAGVQLGPLDIHGRFIFPTTTTFDTVTEEFKNSNIQLSLTYWFGGKGD
jgi:hypothetical protein